MAHFAAMATPAPEMAAPTIQEVLANPLVARTIDTMNELIPGVPATRQNLQTPFDETQDHYIFMGFGIQPGMGVRIYNRKKVFTVEVIAPEGDLSRRNYRHSTRPDIAQKYFPNTPDGLFQALLWTKDILKQYRENGPCPDCTTELMRELVDMQKSGSCMFKAITNLGDGSVAYECLDPPQSLPRP